MLIQAAVIANNTFTKMNKSPFGLKTCACTQSIADVIAGSDLTLMVHIESSQQDDS